MFAVYHIVLFLIVSANLGISSKYFKCVWSPRLGAEFISMMKNLGYLLIVPSDFLADCTFISNAPIFNFNDSKALTPSLTKKSQFVGLSNLAFSSFIHTELLLLRHHLVD